MISIEQLTVEFGARPLFDAVSFLINPKDRIALVGRNGAGKTTLLRLLAGLQQPSSGRIVRPKELTTGYLPQHLPVTDTRSVEEEAATAFEEILAIRQLTDELTHQIAFRTDYESDGYQSLIEELNYQNERLQLFNGVGMQAEIERTLLGLGFRRTDFTRPTAEFSGGWRMRIELAKILLRSPEILLLDEPTNHLDIESIGWLETFLSSYHGAVVLVSHDRAFIDAVTTRTIELSLGKLYDYKVSYSDYLKLRRERREQQIRAYENQQKMIAETEDFIERFRYKATKAVQVQSRIKQLNKLERLEVDMEDTSALHLRFPPAPHSGVLPVDVEQLSKAYGEHLVLDNISIKIRRGEKVAFVGRNGEGKSTLVKCIMGEIPYNAGFLKLGHLVKTGYFAQNQAALLDENKTVFETVDEVAVGDVRAKIRDILGAFMFGGEASEKPVRVLSGGERSRLAMIRLLLEPANLLILDEPTNHLDMPSKDVLKEALKNFNGTVILVSHDREFLDGLASKVYEFSSGKVREYLGDIHAFLQAKKLASLQDIERNTAVNGTGGQNSDSGISENRLRYEAQKEHAKVVRRQEKLIAAAEADINGFEQELARLEAQFAAGETSEEIQKIYNRTKSALERRLYEWELLGEELMKLNL
ncbi:MAG: ATP-binding cassette domain-containing protein [Prevotellaceae bacterium]|jgi:ATP-binding cassette subfamily F protein 3|nr:ATP-binding cassette domain-containing protein [Prevotellaceae bacterium]